MPHNPFHVEPVDVAGSIERGLQLGDMARQRRTLADFRNLAQGADFDTSMGRDKFMSSALRIDPALASQYGQAFAAMDENQRAKVKAMTDGVARAMITIKSLPPDQQAIAYQQAQAQFPEALTEPYSPFVIDQHINEARSIDEMLKQQEGFSLSEGQVRFDAQGRPIAAVPKTAEAKWLDAIGPGGVNYKYNEATGQTNLSKPGGGFYTLAEIGGGQGGQAQGVAPTTAQPLAPAAYEPTIQRAAAEFGVPPDLLRGLLQQESNFDPNAVSPAGAIGIAQFMPATAAEMGIDPRDPQEAIYGAAQYLKQQFDRFGSWNAALAAYNFGPGNIAAGKALPQETRDYVAELGPLAGGQQGFDFAQFQTPKQAAQTNPVEQANTLRGEFTKLTKDYRDTAAAYQKIAASVNNPSAAGDISLIFGFMKLIDPGSTVREGEFATAEQAQGVPAYILNLYNKAVTGERLPDAARADFSQQAKHIFNVYERQYATLKDQYTALAQQNGIDPRNVIIEGGVPDAPVAQPGGPDPNRANQILQRWGIQ